MSNRGKKMLLMALEGSTDKVCNNNTVSFIQNSIVQPQGVLQDVPILYYNEIMNKNNKVITVLSPVAVTEGLQNTVIIEDSLTCATPGSVVSPNNNYCTLIEIGNGLEVQDSQIPMLNLNDTVPKELSENTTFPQNEDENINMPTGADIISDDLNIANNYNNLTDCSDNHKEYYVLKNKFESENINYLIYDNNNDNALGPDTDSDKEWIPDDDEDSNTDSEVDVSETLKETEHLVTEQKMETSLSQTINNDATETPIKEHQNPMDTSVSQTNNDETETPIREHQNITPSKSSRKRKRQPELWERNLKKAHKNAGKSYVTSSGKEVLAKSVGPNCGDKCRLKCGVKISDDERRLIFDQFWSLKNVNLQREFVLRCTEVVSPKYQYKKLHPTRGRSQNKAYYLKINETKHRVCCKFFMNTLAIGDTFLRNIFKKTNDNGFLETDKRGLHGHQKTIDGDIVDGIRNHINSIPRIESHYLRSQTTREYIDGSLNISMLYRLYKEQCLINELPFAKKNIYEKIFNTEFNLSFFKPKKDQCALCENYKNCDENQKQNMQVEYEDHIRNKEMSRVEKLNDVRRAENDLNNIVAVYDLEAVLPTPCGEVSSFYYKSKLNCMNFTVYNIAEKLGHCYIWSENIAKRGANEIATCIFNYLNKNCVGKIVTFYSDNCCGQNKNKFIACMYLYAVACLDIPEITHKYLITGHSQNEGDSMHSCIEREKRRVLKSGPIYIPTQWIPVIQLAKKQGKPYIVEEMTTSNFKDFKELSTEIGNNFSVNTLREKVVWNNIKMIKVEKDKPNLIFYKTDYNQNDFLCIDIKKGYRKKSLVAVQLKDAYEHPPPISHEKKEGLLYLCRTNAIKEPYHVYYKTLQSSSPNSKNATKSRKKKT